MSVVTYADPIAVPCQVPLEIVPTLVREEARTLEANVAPVKVLAAAVTVTFALPSNAVPLIFTGVVSFAAEPVVF